MQIINLDYYDEIKCQRSLKFTLSQASNMLFDSDFRSNVLTTVEKHRANKIIGSSLEASIDIYISSEILSKLQNIDFAEIAITSSASINESLDFTVGFSIDEVDSVSIDIKKASGRKCNRCWKIVEEVTNSNEICHRCKDVISSIKD